MWRVDFFHNISKTSLAAGSVYTSLMKKAADAGFPSALGWVIPSRCRSLPISSTHQEKFNHLNHLVELWNPVIANRINVECWGAVHAASYPAIEGGLNFGDVSILSAYSLNVGSNWLYNVSWSPHTEVQSAG